MSQIKKVLVIEDNTLIRTLLINLLELKGYQTIEASNGKEGIEIAIKYRPALIISDIMMPEMDGFEVLKEIRKNQETSGIPFIFLSANSSPEFKRKSKELGVNDYLIKPCMPDVFFPAIEKYLTPDP